MASVLANPGALRASVSLTHSPLVMHALQRFQDLRGPCADAANADLDIASDRLVLAIAAQREAVRHGLDVSLPLVRVSVQALRSAVGVSRQIAESGLEGRFDEQLQPMRRELDRALAALNGSWQSAQRGDARSYSTVGFMPQSEFLVHQVRTSIGHLQQAVAQCREFAVERAEQDPVDGTRVDAPRPLAAMA